MSLDLVAELQRRLGVTADGIYGPATHRAVMAALPTPAPAKPPGRRIGPRARALLHHFESFRPNAYRCPAGIWTIGWGNTRYPDGRRVQPGDTVTREQGDALFDLILRDFEDGVARLAPEATPEQFGAMVSLAYNIGLRAFEGSSVLRHHRAGRHAEAADAFRLWKKGGGQVLAGLTRRREAERLLYLNRLAEFDRAIGYRP